MAKVAGDAGLRKRLRALSKRSAFLLDVCECGRTFGIHGAAPPHTYGEADATGPVCNGFKKKEGGGDG